MKSSGIDWIGNIPLDWNAKKVKYVISDIKDGTHGTFDRVESGELLLSAKNVFDDGIRIGENESEISILDYKSIISNGFPKRNDVLLCCVGTIGRCCVYEYDQSIFWNVMLLIGISKILWWLQCMAHPWGMLQFLKLIHSLTKLAV